MKEEKKIGRCFKCGKELTPALECENEITKEWDEHSYKCDCRPGIIISIG